MLLHDFVSECLDSPGSNHDATVHDCEDVGEFAAKIEKPSAGRVTLAGKDIASISPEVRAATIPSGSGKGQRCGRCFR